MKKFLRGLQVGDGLRHRLFRGGAWLGVGTVADQGLRFLRNIILARLLAPEAFGLMAIVLSVCSLFQVLTGIGIKESVVQNPRGAERTFLNGAWWLSVARGLGLYLLAFVSAPWIARFYEAPELERLLRVAFLSVLAQAALSAGAFVAVKQMRYSKWVLIQQGGGVIGVLTAITLGFYLRGVWALVLGFAVEGIARCLISYLVCPFRPGLQFDPENRRALLRFAGGMFGLPALMLVYTEGSTFALGKLGSKADLGIFAMALGLARMASMFSNQMVDLLMPAFSEIQKDPGRVNQGILKVTTFLALAGVPASAFMALFGSQVLEVLYGPRYAAGGLALALLFANEVLLVSSVPIATVYLAVGKPALLRRFSLLRAFLVVALLWPAIRFGGLTGAASIPVAAMLLAYGLQLAQLRTVTGLEIKTYLALWLRGLLVAAPFVGLWLVMRFFFQGIRPLVELVWLGTVTGVVLGVFAFSAYRQPSVRRYLWRFAHPTN